MQRLRDLVAQKYPDHHVQNHIQNGAGLLTIEDHEQQSQYFVFVGVENEEKKRLIHYLPLDSQPDFVMKIQNVAEFLEITVNAAAQVKDMSQTGVLTLHPILAQP